jgi:(2Fe-2S) ferredoxin
MSKYKKHIFICTNDREGKEACGSLRGMELIEAFKALAKDHPDRLSIRTQKAGCLDVCKFGPALVVYPDAVFYGKVTVEDVQEIYHKHILQNTPVERLRLHFPTN